MDVNDLRQILNNVIDKQLKYVCDIAVLCIVNDWHGKQNKEISRNDD